jgi:hypothetical protein
VNGIPLLSSSDPIQCPLTPTAETASLRTNLYWQVYTAIRGALGKQVVLMWISRAGPEVYMCSVALNILSLELYGRNKHTARLKSFYLPNGFLRKHFDELFKIKVIANSYNCKKTDVGNVGIEHDNLCTCRSDNLGINQRN